MHKYLLFAYPYYYPSGFIEDCILKFDSMNEKLFNGLLKETLDFDHNDEFHIYNTENETIKYFDVEKICKENGMYLYRDTEKILGIFKEWVMQFK